jgi:hypothetical protein
MADNLNYLTGTHASTFVEMIDQELKRGWVIRTIDRTNDGTFYAFLEFPRV